MYIYIYIYPRPARLGARQRLELHPEREAGQIDGADLGAETVHSRMDRLDNYVYNKLE